MCVDGGRQCVAGGRQCVACEPFLVCYRLASRRPTGARGRARACTCVLACACACAYAYACARVREPPLLTSGEWPPGPTARPGSASGDLLSGARPDRRPTSSLGSHDLDATKASLNYEVRQEAV